MATVTQDILYNVTGQSLYIDCPEGRPTGTPTFTVYADSVGDDGTEEFSGNGTVESVNTTVDVASGFSESNRKRVYLADVSNIEVGREYLLTNSGTESEWCEVRRIDDLSGYVDVRHTLQNDYDIANSTFVGTRITASVDDTWVADTSHLNKGTSADPGYRVLWTYTVGGETKKRYTYFDLLRVAGDHNVTINDLTLYFPALKDTLGRDYRGHVEKLIDEAYRALQLDLKAVGLDSDQVRDQWVVDELVKRRAILNLAIAGVHPADITYADYLVFVREEYGAAFNAHFGITNKTAIATDDSGGATHMDSLPLMTR
jgi:hypothetical protein